MAVAITTSKAKPPFLRSALRPAWSIFWDGTDLAQLLTRIKKMRAGSFVSFAVKRKKARPARTKQNSFNPKRKRLFFVAFIYRLLSSPAENLFLLRSLASASRLHLKGKYNLKYPSLSYFLLKLILQIFGNIYTFNHLPSFFLRNEFRNC